MESFKIRNKEGLYWKGHAKNDFNTKGKTFNQINHVRSALTNAKIPVYSDNKTFKGRFLPDYLNECVIVKFELVEKETISIE